MRHLRQQLKALRHADTRVQPDAAWVTKNRGRLMTQINNTVVNSDTVSLHTRFEEWKYVVGNARLWRVARPVLTALVVAVLTTGGWIASVSASINSLPGDRLWSIKRAAQKTELAVKSLGASDQQKAQLQLALAKSRTDEIKRTLKDRRLPTDPQARTKTVNDLNTATHDVREAVKTASDAVNTQVQDATKSELPSAIAVVSGVSKDTTEIAKSLQATAQQTNSVDLKLTREVAETVKVLNESSLSNVEAVVVAQEKTSPENGSASVKNLVNDKLSELAATASTTNKIDPAVTVSTASSSSLVTAQTLGDIKKNIDTGNLREAVNKLKDLNETNVTAQLLVDAARLVTTSTDAGAIAGTSTSRVLTPTTTAATTTSGATTASSTSGTTTTTRR